MVSMWPAELDSRREILRRSICALCTEAGFMQAEKIAVETLTEILQSLILEIAKTARNYTEHGSRVESNVVDIEMALSTLGVNWCSMVGYMKRINRITLSEPVKMAANGEPKMLQMNTKRKPSTVRRYIFDHLPDFPDVHTYSRTTTIKMPVTEYEAIREKSAVQKISFQRALLRFKTRTCENSPVHTLFPDTPMSDAFRLLLPKKQPNLYLRALYPNYEDDEEGYEVQVVKKSRFEAKIAIKPGLKSKFIKIEDFETAL